MRLKLERILRDNVKNYSEFMSSENESKLLARAPAGGHGGREDSGAVKGH